MWVCVRVRIRECELVRGAKVAGIVRWKLVWMEAQTRGMQPHMAGVTLDHKLVVGERKVADAAGNGVHCICEIACGFDRIVLGRTILCALWDHGRTVEGEAALTTS